MSNQMQLYVWSGDWGLPSICHDCLQMMTYCRFSGVPVKIIHSKNPWMSPTGSLPAFKHNNTTTSELPDMVAHLKLLNYSADSSLSSKDNGDVTAYKALLRQKLDPALQYLFWVDENDYVQLIRPWYAKHLAFPLNYFLPGRFKRQAEKNIQGKLNLDSTSSDPQVNAMMENIIFGEAQKCLTLLSERLGNNEFFFGKNPCSFDALVFGYLSPLLKIPFPNQILQNHLKACSNLAKFVDNILKKYFPVTKDKDTTNESNDKDKSKDKSGKQSTSTEIDEFPHKWRDMILSGLFATSAMILYAFGVGILQIVSNEKDVLEIGYHDHVPDLSMLIGDHEYDEGEYEQEQEEENESDDQQTNQEDVNSEENLNSNENN